MRREVGIAAGAGLRGRPMRDLSAGQDARLGDRIVEGRPVTREVGIVAAAGLRTRLVPDLWAGPMAAIATAAMTRFPQTGRDARLGDLIAEGRPHGA